MSLEKKVEEIPIKGLAKKSFRKNTVYGSLLSLVTLTCGYVITEDPERFALSAIFGVWAAVGAGAYFYLARKARRVMKGQEDYLGW